MNKGTCNIYVFAKYKRGLEAISLTELVRGQGWLVSLTPANNPLAEVCSLWVPSCFYYYYYIIIIIVIDTSRA